MKLEVGKTYLTRCGYKARVICTDRKSQDDNNVVALLNTLQNGNDEEVPITYMDGGKYLGKDVEDTLDIVREYSPWSNVAVDTPVLVRDDETEKWHRRYFAKYEDGLVYTWVHGATSWSNENNPVPWTYAKLPEDKDGNRVIRQDTRTKSTCS